MQLYTRTGDKGQTSLIGGRVDKDDIRVEAYGTLDEVNSFVGQAVSELDVERFQDVLQDLETIQHELFDCGGDLSNVSKHRKIKLQTQSVKTLEEKIDRFTKEAPPLEKFILPGGVKASSSIHIARTVTRRAERIMVSLSKTDEDFPIVTLQYINRLSDYFFALARVINYRCNVKDVEYIRSANVFSTGKVQKKNEK
ncbi:cob(I)yrinic acid a,c-diamide adenosyltransferase [Rossellomorea aquimaris]|uniref:cob(I)yrinic acid a,c-diamide adenosyltransferase n=1 Tax=Rossellomorea aquimaris TaxID=189382 RepID=UPI0011E967FC|nr:cob(I)yrinic acid a,c-diamide adenosyltransferase [Rossellomorea aquimaris]TYS91665.1 cob(I)yrinic acid a,c-diamide adenosyltransferase [Rossellomorea aquimaris]